MRKFPLMTVVAFKGTRTQGKDLKVQVLPPTHHEYHDLPWRTEEYNASPTGFECGYSGAGPTQLAYSMLRELGYASIHARILCIAVRDKLIRKLSRNDDWMVTENQILDVLRP